MYAWVAEGVTFGTSTEAQRQAWDRRQWADRGLRDDEAERDWRRASASGGLAEAYASGWIAARSAGDSHGVPLSPGQYQELRNLAYAFGEEYRHASWLYETGRTHSREGYARAWEEALAAHGWR